MNDLVYFVRTWADPSVYDEMVAWLRDGHVAEVVDLPGVEEGWLCALEQDSDGWRGIMTFYRFSSQEAFTTYLASAEKKQFDTNAAARFAGKVKMERLWGPSLAHVGPR